MSSGLPARITTPSGPPADLPPDLTVFEYATCAGLYQRLDSLRHYLDKKFLTRSFDVDGPCLRATEHVGLLPFWDNGKTHLLLIAPKGCRSAPDLGLRQFLELIALTEGAELPDKLDAAGWQGKLGPHQFLLLLAKYYAGLLLDLCRRDFRRHYRHEEDELRSRVRGRLHLAAYARRAVRGMSHVLPCRWDEYTVDNLDNRVLWAAARRLKVIAAGLGSEAAARIWKPFQPVSPWFSSIAEIDASASDLNQCRLWRTSNSYRRALNCARLLLQGSDVPTHGGQIPALVLNANNAFEKFVQAVMKGKLPPGWRAAFQSETVTPFLKGEQIQSHKPDIVLWNDSTIAAVGDAKYKEVLERAPDGEVDTPQKARTSIQASDWNQLYVYMRIKNASAGFFVVPFWNVKGEPSELHEGFEFVRSPCDFKVRVAVLALNLLKPLSIVRKDAADRLHSWLCQQGK